MTSPAFIEPLEANDFADFVAYLNDHLADNGGADAGYFQPLPRRRSFFPAEREAAFRAGIDAAIGARGWRRAWVARSASRQIVGHIDLRAHPESFTEHRCLLGMGVERRHRRTGLGAALALYRRAGFIKAGEMADMFRIDGISFAYTTMSMRLTPE